MIDKGAFDETAQIITAEAFYVEGHQRIYNAMAEIARRNQPIDILTVREELTRREELEVVGGAYYITKLTNNVVSSANIQTHCRILLQKFIQREVIRVCGQMIGEAYEAGTDAFDLMDLAESEIFSIRQRSLKKQFKELNQVMVEVVQELEENRNQDRHLTGITSGHKEVDHVTCGWQNEDLIILAARPSVGKTALALHLARNAAKGTAELGAGKAVAIFSLEMKDKKLIQRLLASEAGIWLWKITNARMEKENMVELYEQGIQPLSRFPIFIDDSPGLSTSDFRSKVRRLVSKHNVGLVIVDYLQLMTASTIDQRAPREQQVSHISRELKMAAKESNIPVIALSQLSREIEKGKEREPQLSDLRESGAIEQDADLVMFLWPPAPSDISNDPNLADCVYLGIKKNRNGAHAKFVGKFKKEIQRWEYLKVIDDNLRPIGENWKPIKNLGPGLPFPTPTESSQAIKEQRQDDDETDIPY